MLINGSQLVNCPILSLHVAGEVARVVELIVDPDSLKVAAFRVEGKMVTSNEDILPIASVREFSRMGMVIDSIDELVSGEDIVRVKEILGLNFALPGLKVVTRKGSRLGKVSDFTVEISGWYIQQLIVQRPVIKGFFDPELRIARTKIVEVDDYKIVVKDEHEKVQSKLTQTAPADFVPNFVNPFREPEFSQENL